MNIKQIKSPNFSFREGHKPLIAVIHIAEGDKKSVISEFSSFSTQKSSHYLVCKDGEIIQFVPENLSAWTQGFVNNPTNEIVIQHTKSRININQISISLEHEGYANQPLTPIQYEASAKLLLDICQRNNIPLNREHIVKHNEINSAKTCPGKLDIARLIIEASKPSPISLIPPENVLRISLLQKLLQLYQKLLALLQQDRTFGAVRSPEWRDVRADYISKNPHCAVCGKKGLIRSNEVHHILPFHIREDLELSPDNFITLCRTHHFEWGHLFSFRSFNSEIKNWSDKIKNRP